MADVDLLARRAGDAAREEALARPAPPTIGELSAQRRRRRQRSGTVLVVGLAVAGVVAVAQLMPGPRLVIDPTGPPDGSVLPLPEPGSALPAQLDDGTPVFVSRLDDGEVFVFDATSPHQDIKLLAHCTSNGGFEDVRSGSQFTADGIWLGGPAPTGLAAYPHERFGDDRVRITGPAGTPGPRSDIETLPEGFDPRPFCFGTETGDHPERAVYHLPDRPPPVGELTLEAERWRWVRADFEVRDDTLVMCSQAPCGGDAFEVDEGWLPGLGREAADELVLARLRTDGRAEIRLAAVDVDPAELVARTQDTTDEVTGDGIPAGWWWLGGSIAGIAAVLVLWAANRHETPMDDRDRSS